MGNIADERTEKIKSYLKRLNEGESIESVREDFVKEFSQVDATEIMKAEQELIESGTPLEEVQRLCDVHSALFHETAIHTAKKMSEAEKAVKNLMDMKAMFPKRDYSNKQERSIELEAIKGHPLNTLKRENDALAIIISEIKKAIEEKTDFSQKLAILRGISTHYAKKGDLLYPQLKVKYGVTGPSDVMWTVDDEIRDEISSLAQENARGDKWFDDLLKALTRAEEMIYKEENIFFPICAVNFDEQEWVGIYNDSKDYPDCFGIHSYVWDKGEAEQKCVSANYDGEVVMPGGHMSVEQITALFNTIPMEITFIDSDNINRFFNEGEKMFKRPSMAIDREVFSCHPPKIEPMVRAIIDDFRAGKRDVVPVWMEKGGRDVLVRYMAVRDRNGKYLGTCELVQDMEFAKEHFKNH